MRRWGLIPSWAKDPAIGAKTFNARAETVAEKPSFRAAFKSRRCLIPVTGFYEWQTVGKAKTPFFITSPDPDEMLVFAGLFETWRMGEEIPSCTIITTEANAFMRGLHTRMPVILPPEAWEVWLSSSASLEGLLGLLRPAPEDVLQAWQVRPLRGDGQELIEPAE
jgi:putative SOS response-associated peptidase YedK